MVAGEPLHQHAGKLGLAVQEDALIGHKHVVEDGQGLHPAELTVAHVQLAALQLPGVTALAADDHVDARGVRRYGEGDGVVPVIRPHGLGGHDNDLMAVDDAGLVGLGPAHHHAVRTALHHAEEQIGVILGMRRLGAVALGVGHGAVHGQVVLLHVGGKFPEVLVIAGAVLLIHLIGGGEHRVEGVHAHAALEAGGGLLPQQPLHLHLLHQILCGLVDVGEAVDPLPGQGGYRGHQILVLRLLRQIIGHTHAVQRRPQDGIVHGVVDLLSEHVHLHVQLADALNILLSGHEWHRFHLHFGIVFTSTKARRGLCCSAALPAAGIRRAPR